MELCPSCGEFVPELSSFTGWCSDCSPPEVEVSQVEAFLARNADHIEHYLLRGYSLRDSLRLVKDTLRPTCIVCGDPIKRAKQGAVFCRSRTNCRYWQRRYKYLYQTKGLSKAESLALVINELTGD